MNAQIKGLIIISFNLLILLGIGILWMQSVKERRIGHIQSVKVSIQTAGNGSLLEEKDVRLWVQTFYEKDFTKIPVYRLRLDQLEKHLQNQPLVRSLQVYVDPQYILHIKMDQRQPVVRVVDVHGGQFYLDETGFVIPVSSKYGIRVPVATGLLTPVSGSRLDDKNKLHYGGLIEWVKAIEADSFAKALVEQIDLDENGDFILIPKIGHEKIMVGGAEAIEDKLNRLKLFYRENMGRQGWNVYKTINLKFKGQIVGRKENLES